MTRDVVIVMAAGFFYMAGTMMGTTLIVGYSHALGAGGELAGMIAGTMNVVSLFCRPGAGRLSDRVSLRRLAVASLSLMIAANAGYMLAPSPFAVMAARVVNGVGFSCLSVCLAAWLTALVPLAYIGKGMGYYGLANALAMALGPATGIRLAATFGYRAAFVAATAGMIAALVMVLSVRDGGSARRTARSASRPAMPPSAPPRVSAASPHALLDHVVAVRVIPVALVFMLFAIPYCATQSYIVTYVSARRLTVDVGLFFPAYAVALLVLRVAMRNLFDRRSFTWFLWLCSACMLVTLGALAVMRNDGMLLVGAVFMAASYGLMSSVSQSAAVRLAGEGHGGQGNATYYIGIDLGMALGPIIGGQLYAKLDPAWFYPALMLAVPLAVAVHLVSRRRGHGTRVHGRVSA
ncbi:multidrug transport protein [Bifidobacterium sp. DSM 109958]|uniref:Multidrug transport protein n=1 Tax=Bifidobacterium moraviense TaxID=2675323 RepID=A0A7Y0HZC8_9BIFI|nr:MFS transporter [Bifidobacterium sp. DSM 109958]NMN00085.1 multidrug transport protein [Bifidobacterium sp. DSM 109958]